MTLWYFDCCVFEDFASTLWDLPIQLSECEKSMVQYAYTWAFPKNLLINKYLIFN